MRNKPSLQLYALRNFIFVFLPLLMEFGAMAQNTTWEYEPNNTILYANQFDYETEMIASLGSGDYLDIFRLPLNWNATILIYLQYTNNGSDVADVKLRLYHSLLPNAGSFGNAVSSKSYPLIEPGETLYDTIRVCGRGSGDYYLTLENTTGEQLDYTAIWYPINAATNDEPNDTRATAKTFTFGNQVEGGINYTTFDRPVFPNLGFNDRFDYFITTIPAVDLSDYKLYINAQNNDCEATGGLSRSLRFLLYKNGETSPFSQGYVGNNFSVGYLETVSSAIPLTGLSAGDQLTIYLENLNAGAFKYDFICTDGAPFNDEEDNCCEYNAISISAGQVKGGNVGAYLFTDEDGYDVYDEGDLYRFYMPHPGSIDISFKALNAECTTNEYYYLYADITDGYNHLGDVRLAEWENYDGDLECNTEKNGVKRIRALKQGVYYIRLNTGGLGGKINYNFSYSIADSTLRNDAEPNNDTATAILLNPGETKVGNVKFKGYVPFFDQEDYYKINLTANGNIEVTVKGISRMDYEYENNFFFSARLRLELVGRSGTVNIPETTVTSIMPDSSYTVTASFCGVEKGTSYLRLNSMLGAGYFFSYEYEISYQPTLVLNAPSDPEPNNTRAQAVELFGPQQMEGTLYFTGKTNDTEDHYFVNIAAPDSLRIIVEVTNVSCQDDRSIRLEGRNRANQFRFDELIGNTSNIAAGATIKDTIRINVTTADTIFLRLYSSLRPGPFTYKIRIDTLKPHNNWTMLGDSTVCVDPVAQTYKVSGIKAPGITYTWSLPDGGGTLTSLDSVANVIWTTTGNRRLQVQVKNNRGSNPIRTMNVIVNSERPTQIPVILHFARQLSVGSIPPGAHCQWYRNNVPVVGAIQNSYYASLGGSYTVKFVSDCGEGPASDPFVIAADAIGQTITFTPILSTPMVPGLSFRLTGTASSGLTVFYQKISGPPALIRNDTLIPNGSVTAGEYTIRISQPGDDIFSPAPDVTMTITITKGNQVINFPEIPSQILNDSLLILPQYTSGNLNIIYSVIGGAGLAAPLSNIYNSVSYQVRKLGVGTVTLRATQTGNASYDAATPVERSFCIGIRSLAEITGDANPCLNTYRYNAPKIPGANYEWQISGGGILTSNKDTAWVQWQTPGNHTLSVKANSPCDAEFTNTQVLNITTSDNAPGMVTGMQPATGAINQQFPLRLSWVPANNTTLYDLYIWDADNPQPVTPFAANLENFNYTLPNGSLPYNNNYKWKVVAKNPCSQAAGPIQEFAIIPLPDLVISDLQYPLTATSGQTITVSWKVTNIGPGPTLVDQYWSDAIFFAVNTNPKPNFGGVAWNPNDFNNLVNDNRPLLAGSKTNPSALGVGESYTNTVQFTLPLHYSFPMYVYGITNYRKNATLLQNSHLNDTLLGASQINVTLLPTPDLRVDSVFAPLTTFSGSTINLTYRVKNYGALTPPDRTWTDSIFISQSPLFDRNQAIPLHLPKQRGNYYPNAIKAHVSNKLQLQKDSIITRNVEVVIPNFIFGTWFIYVKTNANEKNNTTDNIYEGSFGENNLGQAQLNVFLAPTPLLTVQNLTVPVSQASTTQPIGISWSILNQGFRDNIERNNGHWMNGIIGNCPCPPPSTSGTVCVGPPIFKDNPVQGTSYWVDKVYLSANGAGLDTNHARLIETVKHGVLNGAYRYPDVITECGTAATFYNTEAVIEPNANFPKALNFTVPADLPEGTYYLYVYTNATKSVFEYPGTAQIERSAAPIVISRPDLTVSAISAPANSQGTQNIAINYTVSNVGAGSLFNAARKDRLYISNFPAFDASAQLVNTQTFTENIEVGGSVAKTMNYTLPANTTGNKYFYVVTNFDSSFKESNYANNISNSVVTNVSAANPADLIVTAINLPDTSFTNFTKVIEYTVKNNGGGVTTSAYTDSLFVSCSSVFNRATAYFIAKKSRLLPVLPDSSYTDTMVMNLRFTYEINSCWPIAKYGQAYFYVKTNADTASFEGSNLGNNYGRSSLKTLENPLIDHVVPWVTGEATAAVGQYYNLTWQVKNEGYLPVLNGYYGYWYDAVYFSPDTVWQTTDAMAANYLKYNQLGRNQTLNDAKTVQVPDLAAGNYYVIVKTNSNSNHIKAELDRTNNTNLARNPDGTAKMIAVTRPPLPDLVIELLNAPTQLTQGESGFIQFRVTNNGTGVTFPGSIQSQLRLSSDFLVNPNDGDRILRELRKQGVLQPGENIIDSFNFSIPVTTLPGNYILIGFADSEKKILESNESNNLGFAQVEILEQPVSDLIVENISSPDTLILGDRINKVNWTISNNSPEKAAGKIIDGVYLTKENELDSTAVLLGALSRYINMEPVSSRKDSLQPVVSGVVEGAYNLLVNTDILNTLVEESDSNNYAQRATPVIVMARELVLETDEMTTLHDLSRIYKLRVPDSLRGSTILVSLKTNDSLTRRNELYIGARYVPTPAHYDYKFEIPHYGNQRIVMSEVNDSLYYILATFVSPNPTPQQITLHARVLPFALLTVNSNSGGNSGNATVKLDGSLFTPDMTAKLKNGATIIEAEKVFYTNSTAAYATFNLRGAPIGVYDVILEKPDGDEAVLPNGYSIVSSNNGGLITGSGPNYGAGNGNEPGCDPGAPSGRNAQLSLELVVPPRALISRPVVIQIHYSNPTNNDIPTQTRILYTEEGLKLAYTKDGVPNGSTAMYLEIQEEGGPPGIIRAGGSGTITVYTFTPKTVPPDPTILFKLK